MLASARTTVELEVSRSVPDVSTKPDCRMCAVPELPQYFVPGVENLSDTNRIELIRVVPRELLLFEGLARVYFGGEEAHGLSPYKPRYLSEMDPTSKSEHYLIRFYSLQNNALQFAIVLSWYLFQRAPSEKASPDA